MEELTIELINPKAKKLIMDLVDLNLITINKSSKKADFKKLLAKLRQSERILSLEEISAEVEFVRNARYANKM